MLGCNTACPKCRHEFTCCPPGAACCAASRRSLTALSGGGIITSPDQNTPTLNITPISSTPLKTTPSFNTMTQNPTFVGQSTVQNTTCVGQNATCVTQNPICVNQKPNCISLDAIGKNTPCVGHCNTINFVSAPKLGLNATTVGSIGLGQQNINLNPNINKLGANVSSVGMNQHNINQNPIVNNLGMSSSGMNVGHTINLNPTINNLGQCPTSLNPTMNSLGQNVNLCSTSVGQAISLNPTINNLGQNCATSVSQTITLTPTINNLGQTVGQTINVNPIMNHLGQNIGICATSVGQTINVNPTFNHLGQSVGQTINLNPTINNVGLNGASLGQCVNSVNMNHQNVSVNAISVNSVGQCVGLMPPMLCPRTPPQASPSVPLAFVLPPPPSFLVGFRDQLTVPTFSKPESDMERLRNGVRLLKLSGWYHEGLTWQQSQQALKNTPPGTFLVRDSSDQRFLYSLSVQTEQGPTSVRLHYVDGQFRLDSEPYLAEMMPRFYTVLDLISHYVKCSNRDTVRTTSTQGQVWVDAKGCMFSRILLSRPLYRRDEVPSLKHLSRLAVHAALEQNTAPRLLYLPPPHTQLDLPPSLLDYLREYPYSM